MKLFARKFVALCVICIFAPSSANAAVTASLPDVLGQVAGRASSGWPEWCLNLTKEPKEKDVTRFETGAEIGIARYLDLAARGADPSPAYKRKWDEPWALDGEVIHDRARITDPWAAEVDSLERIAVQLGQSKVFGRAVWKASDANGVLLGLYDAELIRRSKDYAIGRLRLWSPAAIKNMDSVVPYCASPGDHESYLEGRVKYYEERASRTQTKVDEASSAAAREPENRRAQRRLEREQERLVERLKELETAQARVDEARERGEAAKTLLLEKLALSMSG